MVASHTIRLILTDTFAIIHDKDKEYFRQSREQRFGIPLEAVVEDRHTRVEELRRGLQPLRMSLARTPYLSGDSPAWADYVAFGPFQWARSVSRFQLIKSDDPVFAWRSRMIDLFDQAATSMRGLRPRRARRTSSIVSGAYCGMRPIITRSPKRKEPRQALVLPRLRDSGRRGGHPLGSLAIVRDRQATVTSSPQFIFCPKFFLRTATRHRTDNFYD